jgi:hypothetical protein
VSAQQALYRDRRYKTVSHYVGFGALRQVKSRRPKDIWSTGNRSGRRHVMRAGNVFCRLVATLTALLVIAAAGSAHDLSGRVVDAEGELR